MSKFSGNMADIRRAGREDRAGLEANTLATTDGRKLRQSTRDRQINYRCTTAKRKQVEDLAKVLGITFNEVLDQGVDLVQKQTGSRRG